MPAALDPRLLALFGRVWPRLPATIAQAGALGFSWAAVSTPFARYEGDRALGHVGVIELPLVIGGRRRMVASIHAVCTDPARRRRGYADALLEQAVLRSRDPGAAAGQVPLFNLGGGQVGGGQTLDAKVSPLGGDSVVIAIGNVEFRLRVDPSGRVLGGRIPAQNVEVERTS